MTPSAKITLYLSARDKIIALPSGTGRRWAETALDLSGFAQNHDRIHTLALDDQAAARQALTHLHQAARDCQVAVTTHPRPFLGDIAEAIVAALPGHWMADIEALREQQDQHYLRDFLWETGALHGLLETNRLGFAAILRDGGGTELLLAERPSDGAYLVGALAPSPDYVRVTAPAPRTVTASDARLAARFIQTRLLPDYGRAVYISRLDEVEEDLRWAQEREPGTYDTVDLDAALYRFRAHAIAFIATLRDTTTLSTDQAVFLDRMEDGLSLDDLDDPDPEALANAEVLWLNGGEELIEMAHAATPPASIPPRQSARHCPPPHSPAGRSRHRPAPLNPTRSHRAAPPVPEHLITDTPTEDLGTALGELHTFQTQFALIHGRYERAWARAADAADASHAAAVIAHGKRQEGVEAFERHVLPHADALLVAARSAVDAMPPARHHAAWRELIADMAHAADQIHRIRSAPAGQDEPDASRVRHLQLWPYVLAWAERSFIVGDLAGQHRPVAPPLSGEELRLWQERAQAAWQRGDLDTTDVWYSARNELITLAYLVEQGEQTVVVLAGEVGSEQMRVLGHYDTVHQAVEASPPAVPAGVLHPDVAPFAPQAPAAEAPVAKLVRQVDEARHTGDVYMALLDAVDDSSFSRGPLPRLAELLYRSAKFTDALETKQDQRSAARLSVLARQLGALTQEIESVAESLGAGVLPPHRTPRPVFHTTPTPPAPPVGPAAPHALGTARRR
ncbi:hypothetical protein [Streptomyces sp. NPDC052114]|uniref:hypothetical protein n=1 Tax=unclassified Streptomyces TaxID=2593676 RepID=UPI003426A19E